MKGNATVDILEPLKINARQLCLEVPQHKKLRIGVKRLLKLLLTKTWLCVKIAQTAQKSWVREVQLCLPPPEAKFLKITMSKGKILASFCLKPTANTRVLEHFHFVPSQNFLFCSYSVPFLKNHFVLFSSYSNLKKSFCSILFLFRPQNTWYFVPKMFCSRNFLQH